METGITEFPLLTCEEMEDLGLQVSQLFADLEEEFGPEVVWELTKNFGGTIVWLRSCDRASGPLVDVLGRAVTGFLYDTYRSGNIRIAMGPHSDQAYRLAQVRFLKLKGYSIRQIVRAIRWDSRNVERAIAKLKAVGFI